MLEILCIIPARSGSKGIIDKNIIDYNGKPLLSWSIIQAKNSKYKMKIIVSTDSEKYKKIAIEYGAEVPFLRPPEISQDLSTDFECINHCVKWLEKNENYKSDIILHLRPTSPNRSVTLIDDCLDNFIKNRSNYDSLRSVIPFDKSPFKMYKISNNHLLPLFRSIDDIYEPYNQARQILPQCYLHNGYVDILNTNILQYSTISGNKILPYIMKEEHNIDIDNPKDLFS